MNAIINGIEQSEEWANYITAFSDFERHNSARALARAMDSARAELAALRTDNATLTARIAELEAQIAQPVTLTPRQCVSGRECYRNGWDAAIKAAAGLLDARKLTLEEVQDGLEWSVDCPQIFAKYIRALTPPDDCGDCNPLKPEAVRAKCECPCGCGNEGTMRADGKVLCDSCYFG